MHVLGLELKFQQKNKALFSYGFANNFPRGYNSMAQLAVNNGISLRPQTLLLAKQFEPLYFLGANDE